MIAPLPTTTPSRTKNILLTGATGYLGQHLLYYLVTNGIIGGDGLAYHIYAVGYKTNGLQESIDSVVTDAKISYALLSNIDLSDPSSVDALFTTMGTNTIDYCVHTAAISSPKVCEQNPDVAVAVNVPQSFFNALYEKNPKIVVIALSTDQVYDGNNPPYYDNGETNNPPQPCNVYGKTKLAMEQYLIDIATNKYPQSKLIVLRSSIIIGRRVPFTTTPSSHETFFHFCQSRIGIETTYYTDEKRSIVALMDVLQTIMYFIRQQPTNNNVYSIYNMGGIQSLSRYDMAVAVVRYLAAQDTKDPPITPSAVKEEYLKYVIPAEKGIQPEANPPSPLDITMDSTKLYTTIDFQYQTLDGMLQKTFS